MKLIEAISIVYLLSVIAIAIYLRWLYTDILRLRNPGENMSFTHDDGSTFAPLPFYEEYGDTEEIKQLIKKRNRISILFCFMFFLPFILAFFIKIN